MFRIACRARGCAEGRIRAGAACVALLDDRRASQVDRAAAALAVVLHVDGGEQAPGGGSDTRTRHQHKGRPAQRKRQQRDERTNR